MEYILHHRHPIYCDLKYTVSSKRSGVTIYRKTRGEWDYFDTKTLDKARKEWERDINCGYDRVL